MITPLKRITALICTLCMIIAICPDISLVSVSAASQYTESVVEIKRDGQVVDSFQGIDATYITGYSDTGTYSCARYVSTFYARLFGVDVYNINMTNDKPSVYLYGHTTELKKVSKPIPGDIMQNKTYSHVAIVKEVVGSEVTLIEQNYKWTDYLSGKIYCRVNRKTTPTENYYYRLYIDGVAQVLDQTAPTISSAKASKLSCEGFTISANVSDNSAVATVKVGTYVKSNGVGTAKWTTLSNPSSSISVKVKTSDFDYADGTYVTVIEAYDQSGNKTTKTLNTYIDTTAPKISNVKISGVTAKGYTVTCTVADPSNVSCVKFPTWTTKNSTDDLDSSWATSSSCDGSLSGSTATFYVDTAKHNKESGEYNTYIYAYDTFGNYSEKGVSVTISPATGISLNVTDLTISKEKSATLVHTLKGSNVTDEVTWSTSDKSTATVSNGKVIGKNVGKATITAKTTSGKSAKCAVTVTANIADMSFSSIADQYYTGGALKPSVTVKNGATKLVKDTDYSISYSSNTKVGIAKVTIKGKGLYTGTKTLTFKIGPTNVTGAKASTIGGNYVTLSWNKVANASGYYVYKYNSSTARWVKTADVSSTTYKDTGLSSCATYKYKVKAYYNANGTACTSVATNTIKAVTNPLKSKIALAKSGKNIKVSWNVQSKASGYQIYVSPTGKKGTFTLSKTVTNPAKANMQIKSLSGANYVKVRAYKIVDGKTQTGVCSNTIKITM